MWKIGIFVPLQFTDSFRVALDFQIEVIPRNLRVNFKLDPQLWQNLIWLCLIFIS